MCLGCLYVGGFLLGLINFVVNIVGVVLFVVIGDVKGYQGYIFNVIVCKDSLIQKMIDFKGKKVVYIVFLLNFGYMVLMVLFFKLGVILDKDYKVIFFGKYDQFILGVNLGDYDVVVIVFDVFDWMVECGVIKVENFCVIWYSEKFLIQDFVYVYDLELNFCDKMFKCFYDYCFIDELKKVFVGFDCFYLINYKKDFEMVCFVVQFVGEFFNCVVYDKQNVGKK